MSRDSNKPAEPLSLSRWSKRKLESARAQRAEPAPASASDGPSQAAVAVAAQTPAVEASKGTNATATLPPPETLPPDSDFTAYFALRDEASEPLRRAALKQVLRDPRFNVMDGLDVYIDDYTKPSPIPENLLPAILRAGGFLEAPKTDDDAATDLTAATVPANLGETPRAAVTGVADQSTGSAGVDAGEPSPAQASSEASATPEPLAAERTPPEPSA
jgi:hypothetical protein